MTALDYLKGFSNATLQAMSDADLTIQIDIAKLEVSKAAFGKQYELAVALLAAHNILMEAAAAAAGAAGQTSQVVLEERDGDVMRKYADTSSSASISNDGDLDQTVYGRRYLRLRAPLLIGPITSSPSRCCPPWYG